MPENFINFPSVNKPISNEKKTSFYGHYLLCLSLLEIPFVGANMLDTVICGDKEITKRLLSSSGILTVPYLVSTQNTLHDFDDVVSKLGRPFVIKPSQMGCSAGVSKVENQRSYEESLVEAFKFGHKILIEQYIHGREMEIGMIINKHPILSPKIAEVASSFYSYEEKFLSKTTNTICPASLEPEVENDLRQIAVKTAKALHLLLGFYRIDFFIDHQTIYVNEINTFPFFTHISLFPKLWGDRLEQEMLSLTEGSHR